MLLKKGIFLKGDESKDVAVGGRKRGVEEGKRKSNDEVG